MVTEAVAAGKIKTMEEEKVGPLGPCSGQSCSWYSMSRTCGPRDTISYVKFYMQQREPFSWRMAKTLDEI
jgi:hypothetical protein